MYHASVGITTNMKVKATNWIAKNADSMKVHSIWIGEDIGIGQDVFVLSSSQVNLTNQTRVGTGIVPITTHNISTLARAALSLHELSNGRFVFGAGIGGIQDLERMGIKIRKPVTALRIAVDTLRKLWASEKVTVENELIKLENYRLSRNKPVKIPIFLGVRGPQMLRLSGEVADGVILSGPLDYLKYAVIEVDKAAKKVGRTPNDVEKIAWLPTIPTFKGTKESLAKKVVAIVVSDTPPKVLDMLSVDREQITKLKESVARGGPDAGIPHVTDELIDTFAIAGDCEHMVDMFERIVGLGITEVVLGPPFSGDWRGAMKEIFYAIERRKEH